MYQDAVHCGPDLSFDAMTPWETGASLPISKEGHICCNEGCLYPTR
jgi:hypothetical protein